MATLDDKLLGEKTHYYCSSSSEDEEEVDQVPVAEPPPVDDWQGSSTNTGPKGVISDFQRWKQLKSERRAENDKERLALAKKLSMTCRTLEEEDADKKRQDQLETEMEELLLDSDDIMKEFIQKRMEEMLEKASTRKTFGHLIKCADGKEFLDAIEKEPPEVRVICHVYTLKQKDCRRLNDAFSQLAQDHPDTKFVCIEVSSVGMSTLFEDKGCPAILIYKNGTLIGNFVRVCDSLGSSFDSEDVAAFLTEHGFLPDSRCVPQVMSSKFRESESQKKDSSDED